MRFGLYFKTCFAYKCACWYNATIHLHGPAPSNKIVTISSAQTNSRDSDGILQCAYWYKEIMGLHGLVAVKSNMKREQYLSPSMFTFYKKPAHVVDRKMQYLFDEEGRRYLDGFGGIAMVYCGHYHPDVIDAIINQTKRLQHSTILYLHHDVAEFVEALTNKLPGDLKVTYASWEPRHSRYCYP